ncbi:hypothetical protein GCM10028857_06590 [Salinarchaeum chitinilyticum]
MTSRVLCLSDDESFASLVSAPLEYSYPQVSVLSVADVTDGVDVIQDEDVDAVVTDAQTVANAPTLLAAVRDRRPELSLLVLSTQAVANDRLTAVAEVVDVLDDAGTSEDGALADWVANSVVGDGSTAAGGSANRFGASAAPVGVHSPHIETTISAIKRDLVDATRPGDVEAALCEQLVLDDRYEFAWIGEFDRGEGQVVPWGTATSGEDWPRSRTFPAGDDAAGVLAKVLGDRTPVFAEDVEEYDAFVPWRAEALARDCRALSFVPLQTDDELFGVLGVYSTDPDGFDPTERTALLDVAETTARVLEGMAIRGRIDQQERILRRHERLVETVGDGMYALDADGHFMTVNDALCSMTGYAREGLLGEHIEMILGPDSSESWHAAVESLHDAAGSSQSLELTVHPKTGDPFPCENKVGLLPSDEDGQSRGTVGVLRDITDRKERERELQRQNERLDAFASIVSHDLRNPLSVAQGYLELVEESADDDAPIERVDDALTRMNEMIDDVLELARSGRSATETGPVHLGSIVEAAWSNVETGDATLSVDADVQISADQSRLLRLLENLFRNAIEHGIDESAEQRSEPLSVTVGVLEGPDAATLGFFVEDDGSGIPPAVRENVFESRFTTSSEGNGIGLWVVSEVAHAHDWAPTATVGTDGGARFEFTGVDRAE